jgi:hypothetical protein
MSLSLIAFGVVGVYIIRGSDTGSFPHIRAPKNVSTTIPPPVTAPVDLTGVSLPGVDGTTTTVPVRNIGTAHIAGLVKGPNGPVPGATVRLEHLAGPTVTTDVVSGPDGHYDAANIAGGRYRVRAFLPPTFAQTDPEVLFLADGELRGLDLPVDSYSGLTITSAIAPDPPLKDQPTSLVVRVGTQSVDANGIVRAKGVASATVDLSVAAGWSVSGPSTATTNGDGDASFTIVCRANGVAGVQVQVRPVVTDPPQPAALGTSTCIDPSATTTTPTSSAPPQTPPTSPAN